MHAQDFEGAINCIANGGSHSDLQSFSAAAASFIGGSVWYARHSPLTTTPLVRTGTVGNRAEVGQKPSHEPDAESPPNLPMDRALISRFGRFNFPLYRPALA
jgi:hypothetical protein